MSRIATARALAVVCANEHNKPYFIWLEKGGQRCFVLPPGKQPPIPCEIIERILPEKYADIPAIPEL